MPCLEVVTFHHPTPQDFLLAFNGYVYVTESVTSTKKLAPTDEQQLAITATWFGLSKNSGSYQEPL